jgi:aerobic carbon-monoxide dehydrogenase large subunit
MPGIEAGTTAAPSAIVNAIANALPAEAAAAIQMPVTAQAVWRALHPNGRTAI